MAWRSSSSVVTGRLKLRLTQVSCLSPACCSRGRQLMPCSSSCRRRPTTPALARSSPLGMSRSCCAVLMPRSRHQRLRRRPTPQRSSTGVCLSQLVVSPGRLRSKTPACCRSPLAMWFATFASTLLVERPMAMGSPRLWRIRLRRAVAQGMRSPLCGLGRRMKASSIE